ncbi:MAG TPA: zinc metalloprotease HtpX [Thermoanaerobaculia bacterium]|nr:zinc metalloprotease HtpX [Thermoanaerobaculia bacterium]
MNSTKTALLLGFLTGLLLLGGYLFGGQQGALFALFLAAAMNFVSYFWSDKIVLSSYGARAVSEAEAPKLYAIVRRLAERASIPMPRLYVIDSPALNAFATGRNPQHAAVAATTGILQNLDEPEIEGVLGHELSHVLNRDILISSVAATLAGALTYLSRFALFAGGGSRDNDGRRGSNPLGLLFVVLAPFAAMLIQLAVSRSREYEADASGARLVGDPRPLASALEKLEVGAQRIPLASADPTTAHLFIVNPLRGGGLASLFSTHPPIAERIRRLLAMPV